MRKKQGKFVSTPTPEALKTQKQVIVDYYVQKRKKKTEEKK